MLKRAFDALLSIVALVLLSPMLCILYVLIKHNMGAPVLFRQTRLGRNGVPFRMVKFRSMRDEVDINGVHLPDHERITPLGQKLRSTSLDELPEFWNVLKGEMSLVGPRPLLMEYLPLYSSEQARRMDVPPGITGLAQINGRNTLSWEEKFAMDVWYVDNRTLWLDIKIIWMTIYKVLKRDGISADGEATVSKFTGNK